MYVVLQKKPKIHWRERRLLQFEQGLK
jgi:hypothetical protein